MKKKYSRKELQGWGAVNRQVAKRDISFLNVSILSEVEKEYSQKIEKMVENLLCGLGFPQKEELDMNLEDHMHIYDMYDDIERAGLKYISSIHLSEGE